MQKRAVDYFLQFLKWKIEIIGAIAVAFVAFSSVLWLSIARHGRSQKRRIFPLALALVIFVGALYYLYAGYQVFKFFNPRYELAPSVPGR